MFPWTGNLPHPDHPHVQSSQVHTSWHVHLIMTSGALMQLQAWKIPYACAIPCAHVPWWSMVPKQLPAEAFPNAPPWLLASTSTYTAGVQITVIVSLAGCQNILQKNRELRLTKVESSHRAMRWRERATPPAYFLKDHKPTQRPRGSTCMLLCQKEEMRKARPRLEKLAALSSWPTTLLWGKRSC
jgi:hypothetical protein